MDSEDLRDCDGEVREVVEKSHKSAIEPVMDLSDLRAVSSVDEDVAKPLPVERKAPRVKVRKVARRKQRVKERQIRRVALHSAAKMRMYKEVQYKKDWLLEGEPAPSSVTPEQYAWRHRRMKEGYWCTWKRVPWTVKVDRGGVFVKERRVTYVQATRPPACAIPVSEIVSDPLFELLFDREITWLGKTHVHRSWMSVAVCVLIEREGVWEWNSKGVQIPAGLLMVAPIWAEHQQAYIDHGCPWYLMGRAVTYVPIGVHEWRLPRGLHGLILDFLIGDRRGSNISFCRRPGCQSREYWGISGMNGSGSRTEGQWFDRSEWNCVGKDDRHPGNSEAGVPASWCLAGRNQRMANPEGFCHRCCWVLPCGGVSTLATARVLGRVVGSQRS